MKFSLFNKKKGSVCLLTLPFIGCLLENIMGPRRRPSLLILQRKVTGLLTFGIVNTYLQNEHRSL